MFPFIAFYNGKQTTVRADTSFQAQALAAAHFKAKKSYQVTVMRADITHSTATI